MTIGQLRSESFGTCLLLLLPEDVIAAIPRFLSPSGVCNLTLCCKSLYDLVLPLSEIVQWRTGISSYKTLCRFLLEVMKPLLGVWVNQVPELRNLVYVMPGFLSVVGCRIIPQEGGPLGIQEGRIMWSPMFEIISGFDGSAKFFLHGRGEEGGFLYSGAVTSIKKSCNVLSLEVEPKMLCSETKSEDKGGVTFQELDVGDRLNLLEIVTGHVGLHALEPLCGKLFPTLLDNEGMSLERRTMLLKMHKFGRYWENMNLEDDEFCYNLTLGDLNKIWKIISHLSAYFHVRCVARQSFISSGDTFVLSLKASNSEDSSNGRYPGWPKIDLGHFYLHKLAVKNPIDDGDQEYAGLWEGTFGRPPSKCSKGETGKVFYLLRLTYEESRSKDNERHLVGTKILEGTHYADHPNGSPIIASGYGFRIPGSIPGSLYVLSGDHLAFVWHEKKNMFSRCKD
ncbi:hypothetical protein Bca52824_027738 [Brassica carinata]|uniref:F-box domain-containing protein n=1 Tax=Brassica carinata TaxID=52824 RepID=A0A8X8ALR8_BRACI|nr:hypothetical protein Bca52824_027738 [Brassica carinata]